MERLVQFRGSPRGLWGTREQGNFYNGNTGTKQKNHGEQGNIKYIGEQGNKLKPLYLSVLTGPHWSLL